MNLRQGLNLLAVVVTITVNALANSLPINGITTGQVSDSFPVLFTPAGYVFSIWGLIYLGVIGFAVYQSLPAQRENPRLARVGWWFVASNLFNSVWIFFWHYGLFALTMLAMLGLLVSLLMIYVRLEIGRRLVGGVERLLVDLPFSIYLGWISVATIANASVFLYDLGWNGGALGPVPWTVALLLIATALGLAMTWLRSEVAYPLVLIWAFIGIVQRQAAVPAVSLVAGLGALILVVSLAVRAIGRLLLARRGGDLRRA